MGEEEIVRNNTTKITSDLGFFMITTDDHDKEESLEDNINEKYKASNSCRVNIEKLVINQADNAQIETNMMSKGEKEADIGAVAKIQENINPFFVNTSIPLKEMYSMSLKTSQCKVDLLRISLSEAEMLSMADVLCNMDTNERIPSSSQSESELKNTYFSYNRKL